jgi:hypothetical protein
MKQLLSVPLYIILVLAFFQGCSDEDNPVTPAGKIIGKYRTTSPVEVKIQTDFCTGTLEDIGYEYWTMNWEIKERSDPNQVDITIVYSRSGFKLTNTGCTGGTTGYIPEPSPIFAWGYINGDVLTINYDKQNIMSVDISDVQVLSGDLSYQYCIVYCQKMYTDQDDFELAKE